MNILKADTSQFSCIYAFLIFFHIFNVSFVSAMSEKIQKFSFDEKAKNRINVLLRHINNNEVNNNQLIFQNKTCECQNKEEKTKTWKEWGFDRGADIIFLGQVIEASKTIYDAGDWLIKKGEDRYRQWEDDKAYNELETLVEKYFEVNGYYLSQEYLDRLVNLMLINKIRVSQDIFKALQKECAINIFRYPYYLQDDYEKVCIDLSYNKNDAGDSKKIIGSKKYKSQPENKDVIKNMNDIFVSAFKRSEISLTKKYMKFKVTKNDHKILTDALEETRKFDYFKPLIIYTSSSFDEKYSTNYKRQLDYIKMKNQTSKKEN